MAGTFVLTDTLGTVFDSLFADTTKGVDTVVRAKEPFKAQGATRPAVPEELAQLVASVPGVDRAQGSVFGYALVQKKAKNGVPGEAIQNQAPTFGTSWYRERTSVNQSLGLVPYRGERGRQPSAPNEVALDIKTAQDGGYRIGDPVTITFLTVPPKTFTLTGVFEFGGKEDGLAGATLAAFTPKQSQVLTDCNQAHGGQADQQAHTEDPVGAILAIRQVTDGIIGADSEEQTDAEQHHFPERVEPDPAGGGRRRGIGQQKRSQHEMPRRNHRQNKRPEPVIRNHPGEQSPGQRQQNKSKKHPATPP